MGKAFASALEKVKNESLRRSFFDKGERILCALSGGADSVALLLLLKELSGEMSIELAAAHLNHGIRGAEADRDEAFCRELCEKNGIPFCSEKADVPALAKELGKGLEETAREVRYSFLSRAAEQLGCVKICTAHHADDNIETVMLHIIRGCGLNGLVGISPVRGNIVRPLLTLSKTELTDALAELGQDFVFDSTNAEDDATRNYIRHNILPHIYALNGSADKAFYRMCASLSIDNDYIEGKARALPDDMKREALASLPDALLARYISIRFEQTACGKSIDNLGLQTVFSAVKKNFGTQKYQLTGGVSAYINSDGIFFKKTEKEEKNQFFYPLEMGENIISPIGYRVLITEDKKVADEWINIYKLSICRKVKFDKISANGKVNAFVRNRKAGDSYVFGRMNREVRKQLINFKIPVYKRDRLPVFCVDDEIFLVHGLPTSDSFAPKNGEKTLYIVCAEE